MWHSPLSHPLFVWQFPNACRVVSVFILGFLAATTFADELEPVAKFDFQTGLPTQGKLVSGGPAAPELGIDGPRAPEFPNLPADNLAIRFHGNGARIAIDDSGENSLFDFGLGDAITLEAWVQLDGLAPGANVYVIGKGRTNRKGFVADNQNWALRLTGGGRGAKLNFLFADDRAGGPTAESHWHRWTSTNSFAPSAQWHHLVVTYQFGEPDSIAAWIDGEPTEGVWDMGGATTRGPIVDDDQVWIGSSMGGSASVSLFGAIDEIALYRTLASNQWVQSRYERDASVAITSWEAGKPPAVSPQPGRVVFQAFEAMASHANWYPPHRAPQQAVMQWEASHLFLHRLPLRYDAWGIRESWKAPVLVRAVVSVPLPAGKHEVLMRGRGLSRLWVNDTLLLTTPNHPGSSDGHQPVEPLPEPPQTGLRRLQYGDQERLGTFEITEPTKCQFVFESMVGGSRLRAEPGESLVALRSLNASVNNPANSWFAILGGSLDSSVKLSDALTGQVRAQTEANLARIDDQHRRQSAATHDPYWEMRHTVAKAWLQEHPGPSIPASITQDLSGAEVSGAEDDGARKNQSGERPSHPIDAFVFARLGKARAAAGIPVGSEGEQNLVKSVSSPSLAAQAVGILKAHCFRCHSEEAEGGLRLDSREALLTGGDSGAAAVIIGESSSGELFERLMTDDADLHMPPGKTLDEKATQTLKQWIAQGARWPEKAEFINAIPEPTPTIDDFAYLRRIYLDTVGVPPTEAEIIHFVHDVDPEKKRKLVERLLDDPRVADNWVSLWQDLLAENPNPLKPSLNNTGPFRWFLHEALRDGRPWDRVVTELIMMRGSRYEGGSAGFGMAADNDAPLAEKGHILASTFLGIDLRCARCHDSPYSDRLQQDLFSLAAMLGRSETKVPVTSSVARGFFENNPRESLIQVTLEPGIPVLPEWPFKDLLDSQQQAEVESLLRNPNDSRERLAALITMPANERFAKTIVNHYWNRLMGAGLVEPLSDWDQGKPSHPELLDWLAKDFVAHGYSLKHLLKTILTAELYSREASRMADANLGRAGHESIRFFAAPERRRMTAEQIVDTMLAVSEQSLDLEFLTFDPEARRPAETMINLGRPKRAWEFATLSNERDRPSLSLPHAQMVVDVLQAFGWDGSRQHPIDRRESESNLLQPGSLAHSDLTTWVTRISKDNAFAVLAANATTPDSLVDSLYLRILGRLPNEAEKRLAVTELAHGFPERLQEVPTQTKSLDLPPLRNVSWSNHLVSEANEIQLERARRVKAGPLADPRFDRGWREAYEDMIWTLINSPEFIWIP